MDLNTIGQNAGKIWSALSAGNKPLSLSEIKRKTKLGYLSVYVALGWLGREGKISYVGDGRYSLASSEDPVVVSVFGENAGKVFSVVSGSGKIDVSDIRRNSELSCPETYIGLGWLARENKLSEKTVVFSTHSLNC